MTSPVTVARRSSIWYGLGFALVAGLLVLQPLCSTTYVKLFYEPAHQLIQPLPPEGLPLPRGMTWSPTSLGLINRLGPMPLAGVLGWNIALVCLLFYGVLLALNPTFRMTTGVDWDKTLLSRTYMHTAPLIKAFLILVAGFLPAFALWHLLEWMLGGRPWALVPQLALIGAGLWLCFSRDGIAGDYESGNYQLPRDRATFASLTARGALAGALGGLTALYGPTDAPGYYFTFFRALGGIGEGQWLAILALSLLFVGALAFAWGGVVLGLGVPDWSAAKRWRTSIAYVALLACVFLAWNRWQPAYLAARYDWRPESRETAPQALARMAGLAGLQPMRQQALLLTARSAYPAFFSGLSESGVTASPEAARRVRAFLERREYRTALAYPAFVTLRDAASLEWDSDAALQVAMLDLEHNADPSNVTAFLEMLSFSAATPAAVKLADRYADERFTDYPDRNARVRMGDLLAHLGERGKAEDLYRTASLPPSQIGERGAEHTMFSEGVARGRLLWNGQPRAGVRVGLVPMQAAPRLGRMAMPGGETSPYWLWNLSASARTDAKGDYRLDHIVAGSYFLLVEWPYRDRARREAIETRNVPWRVDVNYAIKTAELGVIDVRVANPAPQTSP